MRRGRRRIGLLFVCMTVIAAVSIANDRGVNVETTVTADSVTVGERLRIRYDVTLPDSLRMVPLVEINAGNTEIVDVRERDTKDARKSIHVTVMTTDLDSAYVPPQSLRFVSPALDTVVVTTEDVWVPVRRITIAGDSTRSLKPQWAAPRSYAWVPWVAGALLLAGLFVWGWMSRRAAVLVAPPAASLPADFVALQSLNEIEQQRLLVAGAYKEHYTAVVNVVRRYVEERFFIDTIDRTSDEILADLNSIGAGSEEMASLFAEADLVKFARLRPSVAEGEQAIETARSIVASTTPTPRVVGE